MSTVQSILDRTPQPVAKLLLYGSGLRLKDVDFELIEISVRFGKGEKDRITTFGLSLTTILQIHLGKVKTLHDHDLVGSYGCPQPT